MVTKLENRNFFIIILILSTIAGFTWGILFSREPTGGDDSIYDSTAQAISQSGIMKGFQDVSQYVYRPIYPLFLSSIYFLFGHNHILVAFIQGLLVLATIFIVIKLAQELFSETVAKISGILMILFPSLWAYTGIIMREVLFVFSTTLLVWLLYRTQKNPKPLYFLLVGLMLGILSLLNPVTQFLIYPIIMWFVFLFWKKMGKKVFLKNIFISLIIFWTLTGGWIFLVKQYIGNDKVQGDTAGLYLAEKYERMQIIDDNFFLYFIAHTFGDYFAIAIDSTYDKNRLRLGHQSRKEYDTFIQTQSASSVDRLFLYQALSNIFHHPFSFIGQTAIEFFKLNSPLIPISSIQPLFANTHPEIPHLIKGAFIFLVRIIHYFFLSVVMWFMIKNLKNFDRIGWIILIIIYFNTIHILIYSIARYSLPIYPFYIILFSTGVYSMWEKFLLKNRKG